MKLRLYSTSYCHLCEQAAALLNDAQLSVEVIDIVEDDELFECYGVRIPVLQRMDTQAELGWPFDALQLQYFITT